MNQRSVTDLDATTDAVAETGSAGGTGGAGGDMSRRGGAHGRARGARVAGDAGRTVPGAHPPAHHLPVLGERADRSRRRGRRRRAGRGRRVVVGWGNLNGVVSSNIYITHQKPRYWVGHGVVLGYQIFCLLGGSILNTVLLRIENKKRREGKRDYRVEGKTTREIEALGDDQPDFMYTV